jgi:hypothetical protein
VLVCLYEIKINFIPIFSFQKISCLKETAEREREREREKEKEREQRERERTERKREIAK